MFPQVFRTQDLGVEILNRATSPNVWPTNDGERRQINKHVRVCLYGNPPHTCQPHLYISYHIMKMVWWHTCYCLLQTTLFKLRCFSDFTACPLQNKQISNKDKVQSLYGNSVTSSPINVFIKLKNEIIMTWICLCTSAFIYIVFKLQFNDWLSLTVDLCGVLGFSCVSS